MIRGKRSPPHGAKMPFYGSAAAVTSDIPSMVGPREQDALCAVKRGGQDWRREFASPNFSNVNVVSKELGDFKALFATAQPVR